MHAIHTGQDPRSEGLTERLIAILSLDDQHDALVEQRQRVLEVMPSISEQR